MAFFSTLITIAINVAVAVGLTLIQKLLTPKKKKLDTNSLDASQQVQRQLDYAVAREVLVGQRITGGVGAFNDAYGTKNEYGVSITVLSAKPCTGFVGLYLNGDLMTLSGDPTSDEVSVTSHFLGLSNAKRVRVRVFLGNDNSGVGAYLNGKFPTEFATTDNFEDMCIAVLECRNTNDDIDSDTGESSIPFQGFPQAKWEMQGVKVCDPRISGYDYADETTYVYSDNPELIAAQADYGWFSGDTGLEKIIVGNGYPVELLDIPQIISNADFCDTKGYTCAGRVRAATGGDLEEIRKSYNATRVESPSKVFNVPEANRGSAITIDLADYPAARVINANRQGYSSDVYNLARTYYSEPAEQYGKKDLPINADQDAIDEDNGVIRELELPLNFVTDDEQAFNLEKEELAISRAAGTATISDLPPKYGSTRILKVGGLVTVENSGVSWMDGETFVVESRARSSDYDVTLGLKKYAGDTALAAYTTYPTTTTYPITARTWESKSFPGVPGNIQNTLTALTSGSSSLTATKSPSSLYAEGTGSVTTGTITITPSGGTSPYTYACSLVSGDTLTINNGTTAAPSFTGNAIPAKSSTYKVVVTDDVSDTFELEFTVEIVSNA